MRVLLAEHDDSVVELIRRELEPSGYVIDSAATAHEAAMLARSLDHDVILIDGELPSGGSLPMIKELRREGRNTPILILTQPGAHEQIVRGLDAGADDYLTKPFRLDELVTRVWALQRLRRPERKEILELGLLRLDRLRHRATADGEEIPLTALEFRLLEYFMLHPDSVLRRTALLEHVWNVRFDPESNVVDVHVGKLRRKLMAALSNPQIETVRGVGYAIRLVTGAGPTHRPAKAKDEPNDPA